MLHICITQYQHVCSNGCRTTCCTRNRIVKIAALKNKTTCQNQHCKTPQIRFTKTWRFPEAVISILFDIADGGKVLAYPAPRLRDRLKQQDGWETQSVGGTSLCCQNFGQARLPTLEWKTRKSKQSTCVSTCVCVGFVLFVLF